MVERLNFSQTFPLGKLARTRARPLYQKLYRRVYSAALSAEERDVSQWRNEAIISPTPRFFRPISLKYDWLLYTDAAASPPCIGDLLFIPTQASISLGTRRVAFVRPRAHLFKQTCIIFGLELLALNAFVDDHGPRLHWKPIWINMENNNSPSAMTRGDSNTEAIAILVGRI